MFEVSERSSRPLRDTIEELETRVAYWERRYRDLEQQTNPRLRESASVGLVRVATVREFQPSQESSESTLSGYTESPNESQLRDTPRRS